MDEFKKYRELAEQGATPNEIFLAAKADGVHYIKTLKLLRDIFGLSLAQAKEVTIIADGLATSLSEYEARFIPVIKEVVRQMEAEEKGNPAQ